jgi:hypothetical protein
VAAVLAVGCSGAQEEPGFDDENAPDVGGRADSADSSSFVGKFSSDSAGKGFLTYLELIKDKTFFATYNVDGDPLKVAGRYQVSGASDGQKLSLVITNCRGAVNALTKDYQVKADKDASGAVSKMTLNQVLASGAGAAQSLTHCDQCEFGEPLPSGPPATNELQYNVKIGWLQFNDGTTDWNYTAPDGVVCVGTDSRLGASCTDTGKCDDRLMCSLNDYIYGCELVGDSCTGHVKETFPQSKFMKEGIMVAVWDDNGLVIPDTFRGSMSVPFMAGKTHYETGTFMDVAKVTLDLEPVAGTGMPVPQTTLPACSPANTTNPGTDMAQGNPVDIAGFGPIDMAGAGPTDMAHKPATDMAKAGGSTGSPSGNSSDDSGDMAHGNRPTMMKKGGCDFSGGGLPDATGLFLVLLIGGLARRKKSA